MKNPFTIGKGIDLKERMQVMEEVRKDAEFVEKRASEIFKETIARIHYNVTQGIINLDYRSW